MTLPDLLCPIHGEPYHFNRNRDGYDRRVCLSCRRARQSKTHRDDPRCRNGHLKTPWTWRVYGGHLRCVACCLTGRARLRP